MNIKSVQTPINRREMLNLIWLASLGIFFVELGGVTYLFAMPRFKEGEFGGRFVLGKVGNVFPQPGSAPIGMPKGNFWLSRLADGSLLALYKVCTHLGCLYSWSSQENKFICPCHGSQFEKDGSYILGPAPRDLDRFVVQLIDSDGNEVALTDQYGNALNISNDDLTAVIDTGDLIKGQPRTS
jgi:cytochrome b6-f complex iron-sulfur subunit